MTNSSKKTTFLLAQNPPGREPFSPLFHPRTAAPRGRSSDPGSGVATALRIKPFTGRRTFNGTVGDRRDMADVYRFTVTQSGSVTFNVSSG